MTARATGRSVLEHEIGRDGIVNLRVHAGELTLRAIEGPIARLRDLDGNDLGDRFEIETGSRSLTVRPIARPGDVGLTLAGRRSSQLEVELPREAAAIVESVSADVVAHGLRGEQRYRTTSGDVRLDDVGSSITAETVSGSLTVIGGAGLDLTARLVSGTAELSASTIRRLGMTTTSGDVRVTGSLSGDGPFAVRTVSGEARLSLRGDVHVDARTLTGRIRTDLPHRSDSRPGRRSTVIGSGGPLLTFESVSGDLWVGAPGEPGRDVGPPRPQGPSEDGLDAERLRILRALERGEIDVAAASSRLAVLDPDAGVQDPTEGAAR
jgi:hypothetical protein